jgi:hypothetical protein
MSIKDMRMCTVYTISKEQFHCTLGNAEGNS